MALLVGECDIRLGYWKGQGAISAVEVLLSNLESQPDKTVAL